MIAQRIQKKASGNSFKALAAYITAERDKGRGDPIGWNFDGPKHDTKVESISATNCISTDPGWAIKECCILGDQNTRSGLDKAYHLVASFPEGERPSPAQLADIESELVRAIGLQDHKRISAVHKNTDNWHVHIAICTVHPVTHRNFEPYYDKYRLQEACIELEKKHGLKPNSHTIINREPWGIAGEIRAQGARSDLDYFLRQNAPDMLRAVGQAKDWRDVHWIMNAYGLEIRTSGSGLAVALSSNAKIRIKSTEIGKMFSLKALAARFGAYRPPDTPVLLERPKFERKTIPATPETKSLWTEYKAQRETAQKKRSAALGKLRSDFKNYVSKLEAWSAERYRNAWAQPVQRVDRAESLRTITEQKKAALEKSRALEAQQRAEIVAKFKTVGWSEYVEAAAARGDQRAVAALARSVEKAQTIHQKTVERDELGHARHSGVGRGMER